MDERLLIIGKSGSGKTTRALNVLLQLHTDYPDAGILIVNHKNELDLHALIKPVKKIPNRFRKGDLIHITPKLFNPDHEEKLNNLFRDIYDLGNTIVYVDEGYMINPRNQEMATLQTQGRSKNIAVIMNSQRPRFISVFTVTQATEIDLFNVMGRDDMKALDNVIRPKNEKLEDLIDKLDDYEYIKYTDKTLSIESPPSYPVKGKIKPRKPMLPKGILALALIPLTFFLIK